MTKRPRLEVAEVFRRCGRVEDGRLSREQRRVFRAITECRTAALGGHVEECDGCGAQRISYNSCRNRHCPKCQGGARARWLAAQESELLPVPYVHVVFTLPSLLGPLVLQNARLGYGALLRAAGEALREVAADPRHLGARIGFLAILHTWGQTLLHHPHVHCVVAAGGLSVDGKRWVSCRRHFFLPVRVLSRVFRGKMLSLLEGAFRRGELQFQGSLESLEHPGPFAELMARARSQEWVVYAKPPFGGPEQVLKYLARYTHRVAIANSRLVSLEDGRVSFRWKDYRRGHELRTMTLQGTEFIRRFLLHVLPKGFVHIRRYGILSNGHRRSLLERCRGLLGMQTAADRVEARGGPAESVAVSEPTCEPARCPLCKDGRLRRVGVVPAVRATRFGSLAYEDTS